MMKSLNKPVILFDIDYTIFNTSLYKTTNFEKFSLYPEVKDVLMSLELNSILGIFSEGESEHQKNKLRKTGIIQLFSQMDIFIETSKELLIKDMKIKYKNKHIIFVDDKLPVLAILKKQIPHACLIWIKRGFYAEKQNAIHGFEPDAVFDDLKPLEKYII